MAQPPSAAPNRPPLGILGSTGLNKAMGVVWENYDPQLRGQNGVATFTKMRRHPIVSAMFWAIEAIIRGVPWTVEPALPPDSEGKGDPEEKAVEAADFVRDEVFNKLRTAWDQVIAEALLCLPYGYAVHEILYEMREDGRVGLKDVSPRPQDTTVRWDFDPDGEPTAMVQRIRADASNGHAGGEAIIPLEKTLHWRVRHEKRSPEGLSMLIGAHKPWVYETNLSNIEAIGLERDLAGLPVARLPLDVMQRAATGTDQEASATVAEFTAMVRDLRQNEQAGVILPSDGWDDVNGVPNGRFKYDITLLSSTGSRSTASDPIIKRYQGLIALSVLADFIMLGQAGGAGSYALSADKSDVFTKSLVAILNALEGEAQHLSTMLCKLNAIAPEHEPRLKHGPVTAVDASKLAAILQQLGGAGMRLFPDVDLENQLRSDMGLPPIPQELLEAGAEPEGFAAPFDALAAPGGPTAPANDPAQPPAGRRAAVGQGE